MYLTFPTKHLVHIHDDKTGMVVTCNTVPEPIESAQVMGEDQYVVYTKTRVFVFKKYPRSRHFAQVDVRLKTI